MTAPDVRDRARVVRAVRTLQAQVILVGSVIPAATVVTAAMLHVPLVAAVLPVLVGLVIIVWGWLWYGSLVRAVRAGDSILVVVATTKQSFDHAYITAQPVDGSRELSFVVPSRKRVRDGEPVAMTGDRTSGRLVLSSATAVTVPLSRGR